MNPIVKELALLLVVLLFLSTNAGATTIFSVSGLYQGVSSGVVLGGLFETVVAQSWTMSTGFSGVSISVPLSAGLTGEPALIKAFLVNQIGPGTTVANQVASSSFSVSNSEFAPAQTTIFSGLDLGPGTYYLVLTGFPQTPTNDQGDWHDSGGDGTATVTFGPGVTTPGWFGTTTTPQTGVDLSYAPASTFRNNSDPFFGFVTGPFIDVDANTPEPSSLSMFIVAFMALAGLRAQRLGRRRTR